MIRRWLIGMFVLLIAVAAGYMVSAGKNVPAWPDSYEYVLEGPIASLIRSHPAFVIAPFLLLASGIGLLANRKQDS